MTDVSAQELATMNFADMAVELRLAQLDADFSELSFACLLETMWGNENRHRLELMAARIGLSESVTRRILDDARRRTQLLGLAHRLLKRLIPHQEKVQAIADSQHIDVRLTGASRFQTNGEHR